MQQLITQRKQTLKRRGIKFVVIKTVFPEKKYEKYLKMFGAKNEEELEKKSIEQIFLTLRSDFIKGTINLDELGNICNSLWWVMIKNHYEDDNPSLTQALHDGHELIFYVRKTDAKLLQTLPHLLQTIHDYKPESGSVLHGSSAPAEDFYH